MSRNAEVAGGAGHEHDTATVHAGGSSSRARAGLLAVLLGAALVAWLVTLQRMRGMDAGPGTDLGALGWYLGSWVAMSAAMMLPSEAPTVLIFGRTRGGAQVGEFVTGYLLAWTAYGLLAYAAYRGIRAAAPSFLAWDERGPWVAGGALAAAGLYQATPLKTACLRHCRSPLQFLLRGRPGRLGAVRMGIEHGAVCVACCLGLMLALFALGVMSLFWMGVVAVAILIEKAMPGGEAATRALVVVLVGLGIWVAASPGSVPGLTQPGAMQMHMETHGGMHDRTDKSMDMGVNTGMEMQP
jgi:predicted metal-binding membrane protein